MEKVSELQCPWHVCIRGLCPWYSGVIWSSYPVAAGSLVASVMEMFTTEHSAGGSCLVLAMRTWTRHDRLHWQHSPFSGMLGKHLVSSTTVPSVHLVAMAATRIAVIILTATIITYHAFLIYILCLFDCESLWFIMIHYESVFWYVLMVITKLFPLPFPGHHHWRSPNSLRSVSRRTWAWQLSGYSPWRFTLDPVFWKTNLNSFAVTV